MGGQASKNIGKRNFFSYHISRNRFNITCTHKNKSFLRAHIILLLEI